ncbi:MAG: 3-deoxy-7-phosphoheptulonate synthase [Bacteroidetes bacterium GWF2_41_61]|jgi:chorismate mutase|nr:MAG: 3-deoxy-7-phosphoheptulonate synthase [Bacteroidetes bacterium GWE2_40_15]OFY30289.1 MAG: 3-deoxy-7-phosphoheptulonate synthase [Bacteroidetes bacterium GWF2_41_61]OFY88989.1 MAG: 3-deoxy-7-phosphoheptulonate synthase [Bacteroidetes bacterium RIFOXYA12_FULL_40_10]PKP07701.1 MAG: 3-deoxy-7-phosphoheptulonate synthase [Bacteroidetes bacterium HGW-Bacteroidetes-5]HBG23955.1 3-deoxy-7-phosphoheptulonate synthase [Rikenellaceae bacterium]
MKERLKIKQIHQWPLYKGRPLTICGPCSAESEEQVMETARQLANLNRVDIFRAGIWKPRTRPNAFEGVGREGLKWLRDVKRETGLPTATEVANSGHVNDALKFGVDVLWIGARTSANPFAMQEIADALSGVEVTVLVKNPVNPELNLWIGAIERIARAGITQIGAIHRGISTYEHTAYRNQPKWLLPIELRRAIPDIPLICDPSHIAGARKYLLEISQKAMDLNYDGLMIESHNNPEVALSDKEQQVTPAQLLELLDKLVLREQESNNTAFLDVLGELRSQIDLFDDQLLELLEQRMYVAETIGKYKKENNITILQSSRWEEIITKAVRKGESKGLSEEFISQMFKAVHQESINHQNRIMNS